MNTKEQIAPLNILLADDDKDDCFFFRKALMEISISTRLTTVYDGEQLMEYLSNNSSFIGGIDVIFLDLSMPRKTGFECLTEIKETNNIKNIPVVVFTTSFVRGEDFEKSLISTLSRIGADEYIRKPGDFEQLKKIIFKSLLKVIERKALNDQRTIN